MCTKKVFLILFLFFDELPPSLYKYTSNGCPQAIPELLAVLLVSPKWDFYLQTTLPLSVVSDHIARGDAFIADCT